jgi:hypothetical protein
MSSISNNKDLNDYFINSKELITLEAYNNFNSPSTTIVLGDTIINYSTTIKVLFCSKCSINLTNSNYINHLKKNHSLTYKEYNNNNKLKSLISLIDTLEFLILDKLREELSYNKYYFKELPIILNNFKCLEYLYTSINRKGLRIHFNKNHSNINKTSKLEANYIIEGVPLQLLEGFINNTKIYFIPKLIDPTKVGDNNLNNTTINKGVLDLTLETSDSSSSSSNSLISSRSTSRRTRVNKDIRDNIINTYKLENSNKDTSNLDIKSLEAN